MTLLKRFADEQSPASQTLRITNSGELTLDWKAEANEPWIALSNSEGTNDGEIQVAITGNQGPGTLYGEIAITSNAHIDKR